MANYAHATSRHIANCPHTTNLHIANYTHTTYLHIANCAHTTNLHIANYTHTTYQHMPNFAQTPTCIWQTVLIHLSQTFKVGNHHLVMQLPRMPRAFREK